MTRLQMKIATRIGTLYLVASEKALHGLHWRKQNIPMVSNDDVATMAYLKKIAHQIEDYLNGNRKNFEVVLDADGTDFQKKVWQELLKIPYGETRSYKEIAIALNDPNASRAVGTANGRNPIGIIVPCHRVISSDGSMGGFAGGLPVKEMLLALEKGCDE
jgi:methylated-DNA-[protein]-cysteine S-methyltransferase